ncbi:hypothetical protein [Paenibacillus sp. GYB003]|uniref:hypothetical protein n=1 Tax=Paenibacillus sp. GYB003 TaxID=2994392 RepID=UPI002F96C275
MNARNTLKRIAFGTFVLGMSGTIAFSALGVQASASGRHPTSPETRQEAPESKGTRDEKHGHKRFFLFEDAAAAIGIGVDELKKQLESGKSIAEVAKAKGIEPSALIDKMTAIRLQKIDEAVKDGKLPQEKADRIKEKLPEHMKRLVEKKDWKDWDKHKERHPKDAKQTTSEQETLPF